jgi:DNA topoisomerase-1
VLRATGQVVLFEGFLKVYEEGRDDAVVDDDDKRLPQIMEGEKADKRSVSPEQHFTQPPPRYTEATLVKRMEELGIGRPSTYASVITTIQDREYVRKDKNRLFPEDKGRIVTIFLMNFFRKYVGYEFTANLEEELDEISAGDMGYKDVLSRFWRDFSAAIAETSELRISEVLDKLDEALAPQLYPPREDGSNPRICPKCGTGQLHLKTSRTGGFVGCGNYPECSYTRPIAGEGAEGDERMLGEDAGDEIWLKSGRFGPYVQRGEPTPENKKPPRASLPKGWDKDDMTLEKALTLLSLPRLVGTHPEGGEVKSNFGRFGPYIMHQGPEDAKPIYVNLKDPTEVFEIGMNRAVEMLAEKRANPGRRGGGAAAKPLKELGEHPEGGGAINVLEGRYGPYVKWEKVNATIPKDVKPEDVTMEMALGWIAEKAAKKKPARKKAAPKKTAAAKK